MVETILANLLFNQAFFNKVWPYMKDEYFERGPALTLFKTIHHHVNEYNGIPSKTAVNIALDKSSMSDVELSGAKELLSKLTDAPEDLNWLTKETEKYVQEKAMYNATSRIIEIQANDQLDEKQRDKRLPGLGAIPDA